MPGRGRVALEGRALARMPGLRAGGGAVGGSREDYYPDLIRVRGDAAQTDAIGKQIEVGRALLEQWRAGPLRLTEPPARLLIEPRSLVDARRGGAALTGLQLSAHF